MQKEARELYVVKNNFSGHLSICVKGGGTAGRYIGSARVLIGSARVLVCSAGVLVGYAGELNGFVGVLVGTVGQSCNKLCKSCGKACRFRRSLFAFIFKESKCCISTKARFHGDLVGCFTL